MMSVYFSRIRCKLACLCSALVLMVLCALLWPTGRVQADVCANAGAIELRSQVNVTTQERAWLASLPVQHIGVIGNTAPLVERNLRTGAYNGISIDVFCFIADKLGLRYQLVDPLDDLSTALKAIEHNTLDVLMPLSRQPEREPFGLFTRAYFTSYYAVVSLKGRPHTLESLAGLPDFRIGVVAQSALAQELATRMPAARLRHIPSSAGKDTFYKALRSGEVDVLVLNKDIFTEDKYRGEMFDMEVSQILTQFPRPYGFYLSKTHDHERLVALFDRYLMHIDATGAALRHEVGERRLIDRYLNQQARLLWQQVLTGLAVLLLLLLLAYIGHHRRVSKQLDASHQQVLEQQQALLAANRQLQEMSMTDGLTGLANRRRFDERIALEFAQQRRSGRPLSLLMLDLDHFKQVNDYLGHATGDAYLQRLAKTLLGFSRRPGDLLARYGGEEIICLLPDTAQADAVQIAQHMRQAVADLQLPNPGAPLGKVTLSIGVVTQTGQYASTQSVLAEADARLYRAKDGGRNRICAG